MNQKYEERLAELDKDLKKQVWLGAVLPLVLAIPAAYLILTVDPILSGMGMIKAVSAMLLLVTSAWLAKRASERVKTLGNQMNRAFDEAIKEME